MLLVDAEEASTQLSHLMARVEAGEEVVITQNGVPIARLVPYGIRAGSRKFGAMKGRVVVHDEIFDPLPEVELDAWGT